MRMQERRRSPGDPPASASAASGVGWKALVGVGISIAVLYFALRGVHPGAVLREIGRADLPLFVLAVVVNTVVFALRASRWELLLRPMRRGTRFHSRFSATSIGFMANNLLPARVGEFGRAYALSRLEPIPVSASFASLVVERLLDGITIVALLFFAMALPVFPEVATFGGRDMGAAANALLILFAAAGALLLLMVLWPEAAVRSFERTVARVLPRGLRRTLVDALRAFLGGLGVLRQPRLLVRAALWSFAVWGVNGLSFWIGFLAFDIQLPFSSAVFLQSVIALAVSLPSAPGFFGLFEGGVRVGLVEVWGVELNKALGFAIGFHMATFIPITVIGLYYVWRLGFSLREVKRSEDVVEDAVEGKPTAR